MKMIDLDNRTIYTRTDSSGMRVQIHGLPDQCLQAWQDALNIYLPAEYSGINKVLVLGMGGSAIGGELLRSLNSSLANPMVVVSRDYTLPSWVDEKTLVIAASYSGNTEETLAAFTGALNTGCKKLVITTGGKLSAIAAEKDVPVFTIKYVSQPRTALGYSLLPLLAVMQKLGFVDSKSADVNDMVVSLKQLSGTLKEDIPVRDNNAKRLALQMEGKIPVLYGAGILSDVARRWKTQINENSKNWAFFETLPELNHNSIVGYHYPEIIKDKIFVALLRCSSLHPRILTRYEITSALLQQNGIQFEIIDAGKGSALTELMSTVLLGDWVSYYLALLNGVDPTPVPEINFLKQRLSEAK